MMHSDPDVLAAVAMGETDVTRDDARHAASCDECSQTVRSLRRVAELARSGPEEEPLARPDDAVWGRISATLGLADDVMPASVTGADSEISGTSAAPVTELRRRRAREVGGRKSRRRWVWPIAAAASVALISAVAGGVVLAQRSSPTVLAVVELGPLPEWSGSSGDARIERAGDGHRDVLVSLQTSAPASNTAYREVWLLSADLTKLVSVGVLFGDEGSFVLPEGIDLRDYPIVDISEEVLDGDPAHSGNSIVRGEIES